MRMLLAGGTGYLGGFILAEAQRHGDEVVLLARRPTGVALGPHQWLPFDLGAPPRALPPADALVHAAFHHLPGRFRGGEGDDPDGFVLRNGAGSLALFEAARRAGIGRIVFLSSRAVYGAWPSGTLLTEDLTPRPDTLYGEVKRDVEAALAATDGPVAMSLRATGIYGIARPGGWHKWADLFAEFRAGQEIAPRMATELHGADLAAAVRLVLEADPRDVAGRPFNLSDLMVDRHELLSEYARLAGIPHPPPPRAAGPGPNRMDCGRLRALGWRPGGSARLAAFLESLA